MKKLYFFFLFLVFATFYGQNITTSENPNSHYYEPYTVNFSGNGTLYYTTDGTEPTLSSTSAINNFSVFIDANKTIKVFIVDSQNTTSDIETYKYFTGEIPLAKIFFKPPSHWASSCVTVDMVEPNTIDGMVIDANWSLQATNCEGWLKNETPYYQSNLIFNNCPLAPVGAEYSDIIPAGSLILYDFENGEITNPPACLNLGTSELSKAVIVKIYPNPTDHFLEINSKINFNTYSIYTLDGRKISENNLIGKQIDVSKLSIGNYLLKLSSPQHETAIIQFIKK